jgi:hypothetical protein
MDIAKTLKRALFFTLLPLYAGLYAFMNLTFKWWEALLEPPKPAEENKEPKPR